MAEPAFKRILLKLSGEALMGDLAFGTDPDRLRAVAAQIQQVQERGVEVAVVVGAGNIYRGMQGAAAGMDRDAVFIDEITHMEALQRQLRVMDSTALTLCMENGIPLYVFNMDDERNIDRIVCGERVGTLVATTS